MSSSREDGIATLRVEVAADTRRRLLLRSRQRAIYLEIDAAPVRPSAQGSAGIVDVFRASEAGWA